MTDMELEQVTANLRTKSVADIGGLASDAFVGHGMRNDGDSMVVLHAIVVQLLGELAPLRKLREALDSALEVVDGEWVRYLQVNPPKWRAVMDALIASKQASAPTGDEHTK